MSIIVKTERKQSGRGGVGFFVIGGLLLAADILVLVLFLVFAIASSFGISNYLKPFVYISFAMSLNVLLILTIKELKSFVRENRSFSLITGLSLPLYYAAIRISLFPNVFQYEDVGTAIIIVLSFLDILMEKTKKLEVCRECMRLESVSREDYGENYDAVVLEQWKTCVEMANSNTEKRTNSNNIFITINAALLAVISFSLDYKSIILSVVGIAVCVVWLYSIESYKKLSGVKYHIVNEIELRLPLKPFAYEWDKLNVEKKYLGLTKIEKILPWLFILLYLISVLLPVLKWLPTIVCTCQRG